MPLFLLVFSYKCCICLTYLCCLTVALSYDFSPPPSCYLDDDPLQPVTSDETVSVGGTVTLTCRVAESDNSSLQWSNTAQQTLYFGEKRGEVEGGREGGKEGGVRRDWGNRERKEAMKVSKSNPISSKTHSNAANLPCQICFARNINAA